MVVLFFCWLVLFDIHMIYECFRVGSMAQSYVEIMSIVWLFCGFCVFVSVVYTFDDDSEKIGAKSNYCYYFG